MSAFDPIIGLEPEVLILGSMPGLVSLEKVEYYAHPRNNFWWIMGAIFSFDSQLDYSQRCQHLIENKVAVWDVLFDCERPGSLDSAIVKNTEVVNDFELLFTNNDTLKKVLFNGVTAEQLFKRHNAELIQRLSEQAAVVQFLRVPSTSPAHASITKQAKLAAWSLALTG